MVRVSISMAGFLIACGSGETSPVDVDGGSGGALSTAGASAAGAAANVAGTQAEAGGSAGGSWSEQDWDAGAIRYPDPTPTPDPPEVGDTLRNEDGEGLDAGTLDADAGSVSVGEVDPEYGYASACLHIDLEEGSYRVVADAETPDPRLERVLLFASSGDSFSLLGVHPWSFSFIEPEVPDSPLPTGSPLVVDVFRDAVVLRVTLVLGASSVALRSIVVQAI